MAELELSGSVWIQNKKKNPENFGCFPTPLTHKHLKSAKYGHIAENFVHQDLETANDMYPTSCDREKEKEEEGRVPAAPSRKSPFRGPMLCLHT